MRIADVAAVVALHTVCFREYFLTELGERVLTRFYTMAVTDERTIAVVLEEPESRGLIGFAAGTLNTAFSAQLVRRHLGLFAWAVLWGAATRGTVRAGLWRRRAVVLRLLPKLPSGRGMGPADKPQADEPEARFLDVGIHPEWRGRMNAELLVSDLMRRIFRLGATRFVGTVRSDNLPSLILHKRLGFETVKISSDRIKVSIDRDEFVRRMGG